MKLTKTFSRKILSASLLSLVLMAASCGGGKTETSFKKVYYGITVYKFGDI